MFERILILLLLLLIMSASWCFTQLWRARKQRLRDAIAPFADLAPLGRPAVIGFSTPFCAECYTRQAPALARLAVTLGDVATVRSVPALDHPELVRRVGVLTVPATVVVDASGRVRHLNLGYVSDDMLRKQLMEIDR